MNKYSFRILNKIDIGLVAGGIAENDIEHIRKQMESVSDAVHLPKIDTTISPPDLFTKHMEENKPPVKKSNAKQPVAQFTE